MSFPHEFISLSGEDHNIMNGAPAILAFPPPDLKDTCDSRC